MIVRGPFILLTSAVTAFIADLFEPEKRGRMLGIYQAVSGAGSIIGPITSGFLIASFFYDGYFLFATSTALVSLFFAFLIKESKADIIRLADYFKRLKDFKMPKFQLTYFRLTLVENKVLIRFYIARLCDVARTMYYTLFPIFLKNVIGLEMTELGILYSVSTIMTLVGSPLFGVVSDKVGRKPLLYAGILTSACTLILYTQVNTFNEVLFIRSVESAALAAIMIASNAFLTDLLPASHRGLGINLFSFLSGILTSVASMLGGILAYYYGWNLLIYASAGIPLIGGIILFTVPEQINVRRDRSAINDPKAKELTITDGT